MKITIAGFLFLLVLTGPVVSLPGQTQMNDKARYLTYARQCANWLESVAQVDGSKISWPVTPEDAKKASPVLYDGTPGVVLFYLELHHATGELVYLNQAIGGGDWLIGKVNTFDDETDPAFYTGAAGVGYTLDQVHRVSKLNRFKQAGQSCFAWIKENAKHRDHESRKIAKWGDVTDVVSGNAGIGIYLLEAHRRHERSGALALAINAGDGLLLSAQKVKLSDDQLGFRWMMSPAFPREMPNYSHGTAGICDFLLLLHREVKDSVEFALAYDDRFLKAAVNGAAYLESLASNPRNRNLIPHHFPDGSKLFYLGWCHGPSGTVGLFNRLHAHDSNNPRWSKLSKQLTEAMLASDIPANRPEGFWNNVGLCCGNAGAASYLYDQYRSTDDARALSMADQLTNDLLKRATKVSLANEQTGLKWTHAEHRVRPEFLKSQSGLMQGAAGVGIWFVKRHQLENGKSLSIDLPLFPF